MDICLNQNNGRKVLFAHAPRCVIKKSWQDGKKLCIHLCISFIYFCMHAKVKNHTLLTMAMMAKTAHWCAFHTFFPINRMLAHLSSVIGSNLIGTWVLFHFLMHNLPKWPVLPIYACTECFSTHWKQNLTSKVQWTSFCIIRFYFWVV
jgi:hypothetical protein